jgi:hypothetical protein
VFAGQGLAVFFEALFCLGLLDLLHKRGILDESVDGGNVVKVLGGGVLAGEGVLEVQGGDVFFEVLDVGVVFLFEFGRAVFSQGFAASPHNFNILNLTSL